MNAEVKEGPDPEVRARELGWEPKETFKGNPEKWVPAAEYLERGETVMPYLQADRRRLFAKVEAQGAEINRLSTALSESAEAITTLKQFTTSDALRKKDEEIVGLRRQLAEARRGGNVDEEVALETKIDEAKEARQELAESAREKKPDIAPTDETVRARIRDLSATPEFQRFLSENPWYNADSVARAVATAISGEIMQDPANRALSFADKLSLVAEQTKARLGIDQPPARRSAKVEGSRGGGGGGSRSSSEPSYDALSAEAKEVCDRQERMVVGPNRAYKTQAEWRKAYAKMVS